MLNLQPPKTKDEETNTVRLCFVCSIQLYLLEVICHRGGMGEGEGEGRGREVNFKLFA